MKRAKLIRCIIILILISVIVMLKFFTTVLGKPVFIFVRDLDPDNGYLDNPPAFHKVDDIESIYACTDDLDKIKYCKNLKIFLYPFKLEKGKKSKKSESCL